MLTDHLREILKVVVVVGIVIIALVVKVLVSDWLASLESFLDSIQVTALLLVAFQNLSNNSMMTMSLALHEGVDLTPIAFVKILIGFYQLFVHVELDTVRVRLFNVFFL